MNVAQAIESGWREQPIVVRFRAHAQWVRDTLLMEAREGPKDYPEDEEDLRNLVRLAVRAGGNHYHEGGGDRRTLNWILGVLSALAVSAVVGGISLYGKVSSLETRVAEWQKSTDRRLDLLERRP